MTLDNLRYALILNNKMLLDRLKPFIHKHDNLPTLNGLSADKDEHLLFKGNLVNEQYEVTDDEIEKIVNEVMTELDKTLGDTSGDNNNGETQEPEPPEETGEEEGGETPTTGNKWTTGGLGDAPGLGDRFENFGKDSGSEEENTGDGT